MLTKQQIPLIELKRILRNYDLGKIKKITTFPTSGNISYLIEARGKKYFLRLCPKNIRFRSREEIAVEIELLDYLRGHRFPVQPALKNKTGKALIAWAGHFGYLRGFVSGRAKLNPTVKEVEKVGECLGQLHALMKKFRTKNRRPHIFDLAATRKVFQKNKNKILNSGFKQKKEFVEKFEKEISALAFPKKLPTAMIHEDLGRRHVILRGGKIASIIDFDRSYFGQLVLDLGQACRGWCFINDWQSWSKRNFKALIAGYERRRRLTILEKKHLVGAIKFAILERALSFCLRFIEVTNDKNDEQFALDSVFRQLNLIK